ncbi:MAG: hypothetical protein RR197_03235 [Oscillospiraceae bacterium]
MDLFFAGALAFALFILYDLASLRHRSAGIFGLFAAGCALLVWYTLRLLLEADLPNEFLLRPFWKGAVALGALGALGLLLYTLFFALPFDKTYLKGSAPPVIDRGMYALCRHPGVLWLGLFYGLLGLLCETRTSLLAFLWFTALDILYVWFQDAILFPKSIAGYACYQKNTPFLVPTPGSIRRACRARSKEVSRYEV